MSSPDRVVAAQSVALLGIFLGIVIIGIYALVTGTAWAERVARVLVFLGAANLGLMELYENAEESTYSLLGGGMLFLGSGYGVVLEALGTSGFSNTAVATIVVGGVVLTWLGPGLNAGKDGETNDDEAAEINDGEVAEVNDDEVAETNDEAAETNDDEVADDENAGERVASNDGAATEDDIDGEQVPEDVSEDPDNERSVK